MGAVSIICGTTGPWAILAYAVVSSPAIYGEEQSFNMQTAEVKEFHCSHCLYFSYAFLHTSPIPGELHYHVLAHLLTNWRLTVIHVEQCAFGVLVDYTRTVCRQIPKQTDTTVNGGRINEALEILGLNQGSATSFSTFSTPALLTAYPCCAQGCITKPKHLPWILLRLSVWIEVCIWSETPHSLLNLRAAPSSYMLQNLNSKAIHTKAEWLHEVMGGIGLPSSRNSSCF